MTFPERLQEFVKQSDMSKTDLAKKLGVANSAIGNMIERNSLPSGKITKAILEQFPTLNIRWLFLDEGEMWLKEEDKPIKDLSPQELKELLIKEQEADPDLSKHNAAMLEIQLESSKRIVGYLEDRISYLESNQEKLLALLEQFKNEDDKRIQAIENEVKLYREKENKQIS